MLANRALANVACSPRVGVDLVAPPVSLLVAVGVHGEVAVVELGVVDVAVHRNVVEHLGVALVFAEASHLQNRYITK